MASIDMTMDDRPSRVVALAELARSMFTEPDLGRLFEHARGLVARTLGVDDVRIVRGPAASSADSTAALWSTPITGTATSHGVIELRADGRPPLSADELAFVDVVGHTLGSAIERVQILEVLLASEHRHAELVRQSPDPILTVSGTGELSSGNPAAERLFGVEAGQLAGCSLQDRLTSTAAVASLEATLRAVARDRRPAIVELELRDAEHRVHTVEANVGPIELVALGSGLQIVLRDISARREAEQARAQMLEHRATARRMESLGLLAGGVAHDFNNLLAVILGNTELLALMSLGDRAAGFVHEIDAAASHAAELTRQLLTLGGKRPGNPGSVELDALLTDVHALLSRLLGEGATLELELGAPGGFVRLEPSELEQILVNLVVNARDAMPRGGRITLRSGLVELVEGSAIDPAAPESLAPGEYVHVSVEDEGQGMDRATASRIFEPFFTTKQPGQGTGLGLAIVHGIVTRAEGHARVTSEPGRGTRFDLYFRGCPAPLGPTASAPEPRARPNVDAAARRILIVDDDPKVREVSCQLLADRGYLVEVFASANAVLARVADRSRPVDLILADVAMPEVSGVELHAALRELDPELPVLLMSGYPGGSLHRHALEDHPLLPKPFTADQLDAAISAQLEQRPPGPT